MIRQSEIRTTESLREPLSRIFLRIGPALSAELARMISSRLTNRPVTIRDYFISPSAFMRLTLTILASMPASMYSEWA